MLVLLQPPEKHIYWQNFMSTIKKHIKTQLEELSHFTSQELIENRITKYDKMGRFEKK